MELDEESFNFELTETDMAQSGSLRAEVNEFVPPSVRAEELPRHTPRERVATESLPRRSSAFLINNLGMRSKF